MHCKNVKEAWDTLDIVHVGDGKMKKMRLQADDELVSQYFNKVINLTNQIKRNDDTISNLMKIEKVL